ncbi:MAG TPA: phosphoadenylyl-sulfate reductase [Acidimicrobiales bacterium]|nr:phosphoadenylyl-sulfate reductase [Acidimicrobiales bacterium]
MPVPGRRSHSARIEENAVANGIDEHGSTAIGSSGDPEFLAEIFDAARDLETKSAPEIISWAVDRFGSDLVMAASFQDAVLIDLCVKVDPKMLTVFLDTHFHFPETLAYMRRVRDLYGLNLAVLEPEIADDVAPCGTPDCCALRKVAPLNAMLETKAAWITGLKRVDTPERRDAPVVGYDELKKIVKVNPMAAWTDADVDAYVGKNALLRHPLNDVGYVSIGCAPTTRPVASGEDPRAGRWPDSDKTECGLHI